MKKKIVMFGSYVADLTGTAEHLPRAGETVFGELFKIGPGGKGSNQAVAAHRAGAFSPRMQTHAVSAISTAGAIPAPSPSGNAAAAPEAVLASASSVQTAVSPSSSLPMKFPNAAV